MKGVIALGRTAYRSRPPRFFPLIGLLSSQQIRSNSVSSLNSTVHRRQVSPTDLGSLAALKLSRLRPKRDFEHTGDTLLLDVADVEPDDFPLLRQFESALDKQELSLIWTAYKKLRGSDEQAVRCISRQSHADLVRFCIYQQEVMEVIQGGTLRVDLIEPFAQFARAACFTGDVALIYKWFRLLLALRQPQVILDIWQELVASTISAQEHVRKKATEATRAESSTSDQYQHATFGIGKNGSALDVRHCAVLVLIACHTSGQPGHVVDCFEKTEFGPPLSVYFSSVTTQRDCEIICSDANDPSLVDWDTFRPLLRLGELARGISSGSAGPNRLERFLKSLFEQRKSLIAYDVFGAAMRASSGPNAWLAVEGAASSPANVPAERAVWTYGCWAILLSELIALGASEQAMKVWSFYHAKKLVPTPRIWNALLDGYSRAKKYDAGMSTWKQVMALSKSQQMMTSGTGFPDVQMYTTMINLLFRARRTDEAIALFEEMQQRLTAGVETYNVMIHGLFLTGRHESAQAMLEQMRAKGPAPNTSTINACMRAHARLGDFARLAAMMRLLGELKLLPDVVTFTTVLDALLRRGGQDAQQAVKAVLSSMDELGVQPNVVTYTAMIKASLNGAHDVDVQTAADTMLPPYLPDSAMGQQQQPRGNIEAALVLFDRMIDARIAPTEVTYSALIGGCMQYPDAIAEAFQRKALPPRFSITLQCAGRLGETPKTTARWQEQTPHIKLALQLLGQMKTKRLPVPTPAYHYLIQGLCSDLADQAAFRRALNLIDEMLLRQQTTSAFQRAKTGRNSAPADGAAPRRSAQTLGPMLESVLTPSKSTTVSERTDLYAISHTSWVVILTSLIERYESSEARLDRVANKEAKQALRIAVQICSRWPLPRGSEGGLTLARLIDRAMAITKQRREDAKQHARTT